MIHWLKRTIGILLLLSSLSAGATHLRSGYISIRHLGNRTCTITLTIYTNTASEIPVGEGVLDFGDGSSLAVPLTESTLRPDLGPNMGVVKFQTTHTYERLGSYVTSYKEPNRSGGIINLWNSIETMFYVESYFTLKSETSLYQSPSFLAEPIFQSGLDNEFRQCFTAVDSNNYQLRYFLSLPQSDRGQSIFNYNLPEHTRLDSHSGMLTWDGMYNTGTYEGNSPGDYLFVARVEQYEDGRLVGYVLRDVALSREMGGSRTWLDDFRDLDGSNRLTIIQPGKDSVKVLFSFSDLLAEAEITVYSELKKVPGILSYSIYDSTYVLGPTPVKAKVVILKFKTTAAIDREQPYLVTVRATVNNRDQDISYLVYTHEPQDEIITSVSGPPRMKAYTPYPNPATNDLYVGEALRVTIRSAQGQVVLTTRSIEGKIDIRELPPGLYFLMYEGEGTALRIIKH